MTPRSPDFICIGAQKAGTWWLRDNLRSHPGIWMPMVPELHYFDEALEGAIFPPRLASERAADETWRAAALAELQRLAMGGNVAAAAWWATYAFLDRDDQWYRSLFAFAPPESVAGEITPRYMLCGAEEIAHMHKVAPHAKLLFMLRHPVERFWSQCKMKHAGGRLPRGEAEEMRLFDTPNGRPRGEYSKAILRFCQAFAPEQMLLIFQEGIIHQPAAVMEAIHEFLGLPEAPLNIADLQEPRNQSASREPMPAGLRARLDAAYRTEIEAMAGVFGGYAAGWLDDKRSGESPPPVVRLSGAHVDALAHRAEQAARRRAGRTKIFCVSMQRSGTTSVGDWLEANGLTRVGSPTSVRMGWTRLWMQGNYDAIFSSSEFKRADVFEDDPWWCPDFFRVVAERYPDAKFILLERDADAWFDSMCHHSGGRNPGWTDIHARIYGREADLEEVIRKNPGIPSDGWSMLSIVEHREHYQAVYQRHGETVRSYFRDQPDRLFVGRLDAPDVFQRMCGFVGIEHNAQVPVPRSNASTDAMRHALEAYLEKRAR